MSIENLPNELLLDILHEACIHPFPRCRHLSKQDLARECPSPVTISHVSRRLNRLLVDSPSLWTCIHLTPEHPNPGSLKLVELFLLRSCMLPISLTFVRHPRLRGSDPLWSLLMSTVTRWQDVALYGIDPQDAITVPLRDALAGASLPHLRSLICEVEGRYPRDVDLTLTAPNLRQIRLTKMMLSPDSWQSCCRNLTTLSIGQVAFDSWFDLVPLLAACKDSLQTLLLGPRLSFRVREDEFKVHLHRLRSLSLSGGGGVGYDEVLKNMDAPRLTEFVFDASAGEVVANIGTYCALLGSVRRLKILGGEAPESARPPPKPFIHAFPNVEQLCLDSHTASTILAFSHSSTKSSATGSEQNPTTWLATDDLFKFIQARGYGCLSLQVYLESQSALRSLGAADSLNASFHEFDRERWQGLFIPEDLEGRNELTAFVRPFVLCVHQKIFIAYLGRPARLCQLLVL